MLGGLLAAVKAPGFAALWPRHSEKVIPLLGWTPLVPLLLMLMGLAFYNDIASVIG